MNLNTLDDFVNARLQSLNATEREDLIRAALKLRLCRNPLTGSYLAFKDAAEFGSREVAEQILRVGLSPDKFYSAVIAVARLKSRSERESKLAALRDKAEQKKDAQAVKALDDPRIVYWILGAQSRASGDEGDY